jgi:glucoamylase
LSHGILNEVYYPRIDQACVRDMGLIVTDGAEFFSEEKRNADSEVEWLAEGVPGFRLVNHCQAGRYRIEKEIVSDPQRDTVLQQIHFRAEQGDLADYHLYVLLAPHLGNHGSGNSAWLGDVGGAPLLLAQRQGSALALACSAPWLKRSVGYVGVSDGWQDLTAHKAMTWEYARAEDGNVALTAEIDLVKCQGEFVLALGFGSNAEEAGRHALASLHAGFDKAKRAYIDGWQRWTKPLTKKWAAVTKSDPGPRDLALLSLAVLRVHEAKIAPGGIIASLSIPWGFSKGDNDLGGYHLVWPRDLVEAAGGLLAAGAHAEARRVLSYLQTTQLPDGHWAQNTWLDGTPYWNGIQMDETALPILLVDLARRQKALTEDDIAHLWLMVRRAASYLVRMGPVTLQDRWEEDPGYSPFTVAAEVAALLAAAELAELNDEAFLATYLREVADVWYTSIDRWMYVSGTDWSQRFDIDGYYVRITQMEIVEGVPQLKDLVVIRNVAEEENTLATIHLVSPDALALVRFGLRAANDPRMEQTATVIDALLKVETPYGPVWHRYNGDGYGEHENGAPFDGMGVGRGWPLLTGERGHYELAAGRIDKAKELLAALESFANAGGLIPEQVWDAPDIPERELYLGKPSGSAMPLVWAHAEYLKLRRSLADGRIFDLPPQPVQRYLTEKTVSPRLVWRFNHKIRSLPAGKTLRIETLAPAVIHWSADDWQTVKETTMQDVGLGLYFADLMQASADVKQICFTFYWPDAGHWEGTDFTVQVDTTPDIPYLTSQRRDR